ncbi:MAG: hypothetical protein ACE5JZ_00505 [Kiloniellales bacterium]
MFVEAETPRPSGLQVMQGRESADCLTEIEPGLFGPVPNLTTPVHARQNGGDTTELPLLTENRAALFFRVVDDDFARYVEQPSRGLNLIVVPDEWRYDSERSGPPPIAFEAFGIPGYTVHYFFPSRGPLLAFERPGQGRLELEVGQPRFRLEGQTLSDNEEKIGPLFVGNVPALVAESHGLSRINSVVIGEEGHGSGRWKKDYSLTASDDDRWPLPEDLQEHGSGWYFLRLYDAGDNLVDSLDFRYVRGLRHLQVKTPDLQAPDLENKVCVALAHDKSVSVRPLESIPSLDVENIPDADLVESIFRWPCDPKIRTARFELKGGGKSVRVSFQTDRIWWALTDLEQEVHRADWQRAPIETRHKVFLPTSDAELLWRFPPSVSAPAFVGFQRTNRRPLLQPDAEGVAQIKLCEFSEAQELRTLGRHWFQLWLSTEQEETQCAILQVRVHGQCEWCSEVTDDATQLIEHTLAVHNEKIFKRVKLHEGEATAERHRRNELLICKHRECGWYSRIDPLNRLRPIEEHTKDTHPSTPSLSDGIDFQLIRDAVQIREILRDEEPWIWQCQLGQCDGIVPTQQDPEAKDMKKEHLQERHLDELYTVA